MLPGNQQKHLSLSLAHNRGKLNKYYNTTFSNTAQIAKFNEIHHSLANIRLSATVYSGQVGEFRNPMKSDLKTQP